MLKAAKVSENTGLNGLSPSCVITLRTYTVSKIYKTAILVYVVFY